MSDTKFSKNREILNEEFIRIVGPHIPEDSELADLDVVHAITRNLVTEVLGSRPSDRIVDGVSCLISIYKELGEEKPDYDFIEEVASRLGEYV